MDEIVPVLGYVARRCLIRQLNPETVVVAKYCAAPGEELPQSFGFRSEIDPIHFNSR
jgi:hypothetical protein